MKVFFLNLLFIIGCYMILSLANMGLVLLFWYESGAVQIPWVVLSQAFVMVSLSACCTGILQSRMKSVTNLSVFILAGLFILISGLNLYLGVSLEPGWFVVTNLVFTLAGLSAGYKFRPVRSTAE